MQTAKNLFRYPQDRLPVFLFVSLFLMDLFVFFTVRPLWALLLWSAVGLLPKIFIAAWNHHHQHVATFRNTIANRLLEVVFTFHTGISTNVWVLHHNLGHHLHYLDQSKDESGWTRRDQKKMGPWEYTFTIAITGYYRALRVGREHPKFRGDLFTMGVLNLLILGLLIAWNPTSALVVFVIPMLLIYLGTCWNTYYHHAGLETDDHLHASHNITNRLYNILSGNLGLHTAHHMKQGLHWSKLPEFHATIEKDIPPELLSPLFPVVGPLIERLKDRRRPSEQHRIFDSTV